jgi:hypothetical protein
LCDFGDDDDDNDGVVDGSDADPLDPSVCADSDGDTCDDCAVGTDGFGPLPDNDPSNDGTDTDGDGACDAGDPDDDDDGFADGIDCRPLDPQLWVVPGEVEDLTVQRVGETTLVSWTAPAEPGTSLPVLYDTVRSSDPTDFVSAAVCLDPDGPDTETTDEDPLPPGTIAFYLARAENGCGQGPAGEDTFGQPRVVIGCSE